MKKIRITQGYDIRGREIIKLDASTSYRQKTTNGCGGGGGGSERAIRR